MLVSLPTGYGKSFCYQALPLVFDSLRKVEKSIVMVVSLLVALMKDQVLDHYFHKLGTISDFHTAGDLLKRDAIGIHRRG